MENFHIQEMTGTSVSELEVELVERKGLGHPDTICDAVMEAVSQALCRAYLEHAGAILHHNCDKGLLVAGRVQRRFGGGKVIDPMRLVIGDRATPLDGENAPDIAGIAIEAAREWLHKHLSRIDPIRHVSYQVELKPGSEELLSLFRRGQEVLGANDTSAAVGYAPLSETETIVLEAERYLNSPDFKKAHPETGEDVKVMAVRTRADLALTVAMPLLDRYVEDEKDYFYRKEEIRGLLLRHLQGSLKEIQRLSIRLNALDRPGAGVAGAYLSVVGTSAEDADSGEVGRGNQVNGLIALNRPRGSEAAAGKNPISHVGKIYSVLTHLLADRLYRGVEGLKEVTVWFCSRIGEPIDQPQMVSVQGRLRAGFQIAHVAAPIRRMIEEELGRMPEFCRGLALGRYRVC